MRFMGIKEFINHIAASCGLCASMAKNTGEYLIDSTVLKSKFAASRKRQLSGFLTVYDSCGD